VNALAFLAANTVPTVVSDAGWVRRLRELHLITPLRIFVILAAAWLIGFVIRLVVNRMIRGLERAHAMLPGRVDKARFDQRRRTLSTVLKSSLVALVWLTAMISVIGELGVNLGAFVATATIIGGALAFGAQTLVRDLIAGFFMIAEDQLGVGDLVDAGVVVGTVERVSLRVTKLSDDQGRVWYLPNGQITRVANLTQGAGSAVVDVTVPLTEDLRRVGSRLLEIAAGLRVDPTVAPMLTGDPQFAGVEELHSDEAVVRVILPCSPGGRVPVRRAFLAAVAEAERLGVLREVEIDGGSALESGPTGSLPYGSSPEIPPAV
jgi:small conductance mechanosensitive channel